MLLFIACLPCLRSLPAPSVLQRLPEVLFPAGLEDEPFGVLDAVEDRARDEFDGIVARRAEPACQGP